MPMVLPVVAEFNCCPVCRKLDTLPGRSAAFVGFVRYVALQGTVPVRSDSASMSFLSVFKEKASGQCCFRCFCRRMLVTPPGATLYCLFFEGAWKPGRYTKRNEHHISNSYNWPRHRVRSTLTTCSDRI